MISHKLQLNLNNVLMQWRTLNSEWRKTKEYWHDPLQKAFEKEHWNDIEQTIPLAIKELENFINLIEKAERELK